MVKITRRRALGALAGGLAGLVAVRAGLPLLFRRGPARPLGPAAADLVQRCFSGIDRSRMWDSHVHVVGFGAGGTGARVNPAMRSHLHPLNRLQFDVYRSGLGITNDATADADYIALLLGLHRAANPRGRLVVLAFDDVVTEDGTPRPERSAFHIPNEYVLRLAREHDELVAGVSIHPYRRDAVARLEQAAARGARVVKWLPNAMGIDPNSALCDPFYRGLVELGLPLICHAGKEYAMDAGDHQRFGNPLRLRRALDHGVRVVVAHCGGLGEFPDLDDPDRSERSSFELFLRLAEDGCYADRLYGDISAIAQINYGTRVIRGLLERPELHPRLIYGSDFPLPAMRWLTSPWRLARAGLLDADDREACGEVFRHNPLLFDFVVKRSLRLKGTGPTGRFPATVFETAGLFEPSVVPASASS